MVRAGVEIAHAAGTVDRHGGPGLLHQQTPFARYVAGQRPPGHIGGVEVVALRGKHVATLKTETGPRAG